MCRAKIVHIPSAEPKAVEKKDEPVPPPLDPEASVSSASSTDVTTHQPYVQLPVAPATEKPRRREIKPWKLIPTDCLEHVHTMEHFPAGWTFNVYDGRLTHYFEVPSECIAPTHGGIRYIEHYNEAGPYSRFRFQVCHNFAHGKCSKGFDCTYIHALSLPPSSHIHVNGVAGYQTLPAGISLFVHVPGSFGAPQLIPSEFILSTAGSRKLFDDVMTGSGSRINRPQHCAHFQFKKVCNRGSECSFIHSLVPAQQ